MKGIRLFDSVLLKSYQPLCYFFNIPPVCDKTGISDGSHIYLPAKENIMNKKYLPSALILYLNYFIHGVGCSILGQAVIKEALAASWGVETMAITAIAAALGLGRLIALPFAGPLSDKLGRRISTAIGSASYAIYLIGLASSHSMPA